VRAWEFRTGDLDTRAPAAMARTKFQASPLFVEDSIIFCSPFNEVIALDPGSGAQKWRYDPGSAQIGGRETATPAAAGEAPSLWSRTIDRPGGRFWSKAIALALATMLRVVAVWRRRRRVVSE
jgi:outer membrane protein assembly factor BamB